jgi:integrase
MNHYDRDALHIGNRDAWGRKLKPFRDVEVARVRYLTIDEAQRLINAADSGFRPLVRAALETGCRYSELARVEVHDFNTDTSTVVIRKSKSGKPRHVILTPEGADFFQQQYAGRSGSEIMFRHEDGTRWNKSEQSRLTDLDAREERDPGRSAVVRNKIVVRFKLSHEFEGAYPGPQA